MSPSERHFSRVGAVAAISGLVIYVVSNPVLHPQTPPHETEAAFADYAVEPFWPLYHLGELLGILLMSAAIIALVWASYLHNHPPPFPGREEGDATVFTKRKAGVPEGELHGNN